MNPIRIILLALACLFFSCDKEETQTPCAVSPNVYVSGYETISTNRTTTVWADGVATAISNETTFYPLYSSQNAIYVDGNDVYVAGNVIADSSYRAIYWKNGVKTELGGENSSSHANSIFVSNGEVFVAGGENINNNVSAVLWRDNERIVLETGSGGGPVSANSVFVTDDGDVYVTGQNASTSGIKTWKNGIELFESTPQTVGFGIFVSEETVYTAGRDDSGIFSKAVLWTDGVPTALTDGTNDAQAKSVFKYGDDVYVAGVQITENNFFVAALWKNGVQTQLTPSDVPSYAYAVFVSEGDVYVSGYIANGNIAVATLWVNGVAQSLTNGTNDSRAYDVFVTSN